jgi:hypothetical protein
MICVVSSFNIRVMLTSHLTFFIASLLLLCTNHNQTILETVKNVVFLDLILTLSQCN